MPSLGRYFVVGCLLLTATVLGCGSSEPTTVIQPGEGYQMTPEEQAAQEAMDAARETATQE